MKRLFFFPVILILFSCNEPVHVSQWRGPNRDGIFEETDLLKEWPKEGPELLWTAEGFGEGHGNVGIGKEKLFLTGMIDSTGYLFALNVKGELLWKKEYGLEWTKSYAGARTTPTIIDNLVYIESGTGEVFCYDGDTGDLVWKVDLFDRFDAVETTWGMAESLLIHEDMVFCTPGGQQNNVVALNRFTGETMWTSRGKQQPSAYCSPILVNLNQTTLLVTMTSESVMGLNAENGEMFWSFPQIHGNKIHSNTPLYHDGKILFTSAEDKSEHSGSVLIALSNDGKNASIHWRNTKITNLMGGYILQDGFVFGSRYRSKEWYCVNWETGKPAYIFDALKCGTIHYADGLFYIYTDNGEMVLVDANSTAFNIISSFDITLGTGQHWAHPVIDQGALYIRHGDTLMAFDIRI